MKFLPLLTIIGFSFLFTSASDAALSYIESINGDLSGNGLAPSVLTFTTGLNQVSGTMGATAGPVDVDIFSFVVGSGQSITSIKLSSFVPVGSVSTGSFFALDDAATIDTGNGTNHAANRLVNASSGEFLSASVLFGTKFSGGASALAGPLGPGTYTIFFRETSTQVNYTLDFTMVPEPSVSLLLIPALGVMGRRRRSD
jgi:hypothetical protein